MVRKLFLKSANYFRGSLSVSGLIIVYPCLLLLICACQIDTKTSPLVLEKTNLTQSSYYQECEPFNLDYIQDDVTLTKPWRIAYLFKTKSDPFWQQMNEGVEKVSETLGIQSIIKFSEKTPNMLGNAKKQISLVLELLESKSIDGLIISPQDSIQLVPVIEKVTNAGIPVIVIDTPLDTDKILTFVTFDNFEGGKVVGEWVINKLQQSSISDNKIKILILEGPLNEENTIERRQGFLAGLKMANNTYSLDILDLQSGEWQTQKAKSITEIWLNKFPEIDVIMAADDQMAVGASEAVEEAKRSGIIITGFDGTPFGLKAIETGKIDATIDQIPKTQINLITQLMITYLENQEINLLPCYLIGKDQKETDILITLDSINENSPNEKK